MLPTEIVNVNHSESVMNYFSFPFSFAEGKSFFSSLCFCVYLFIFNEITKSLMTIRVECLTCAFVVHWTDSHQNDFCFANLSRHAYKTLELNDYIHTYTSRLYSLYFRLSYIWNERVRHIFVNAVLLVCIRSHTITSKQLYHFHLVKFSKHRL